MEKSVSHQNRKTRAQKKTALKGSLASHFACGINKLHMYFKMKKNPVMLLFLSDHKCHMMRNWVSVWHGTNPKQWEQRLDNPNLDIRIGGIKEFNGKPVNVVMQVLVKNLLNYFVHLRIDTV